MAGLLATVMRPPVYILDRIAGLTDEEMFWEPVVGCLSMRKVDGLWRQDEPPRVSHFDGQPGPVTTIAWRVAHLAGDVLGGERNPIWLGIKDPPPLPEPSASDGMPSDAAGMIAWLAATHQWWTQLVGSCDDAHLLQPIGAVAGRWDGPRIGFVAYTNMELTHHSAEVGLLRDLWGAETRS